MKTDFDFDRPGKRMPYTVPDGFFEQMEEDILRELDRRETAVQKSRRFLRLALGAYAKEHGVLPIHPEAVLQKHLL